MRFAMPQPPMRSRISVGCSGGQVGTYKYFLTKESKSDSRDRANLPQRIFESAHATPARQTDMQTHGVYSENRICAPSPPPSPTAGSSTRAGPLPRAAPRDGGHAPPRALLASSQRMAQRRNSLPDHPTARVGLRLGLDRPALRPGPASSCRWQCRRGRRCRRAA